ncbi:hypothetical protein K502DRAFT_356326 [Neoconidiobolus thromboides FSU 785]|nr:hypothetical protein K502DRAFT_356326 [Neoconidiobolus thromboides FSU 785]
MKVSQLSLLLSSVFAADFYTSTNDAMKANPDAVKEVVDKNSRRPDVASIAIHGGTIERYSDNFARKLYDSLDSAAFYNFNCSIDEKISNGIETNNCYKKICCKKIDDNNNEDYDQTQCKDSKEECTKKQVCHPNAMHVTSTVFDSKKFSNLIRSKFIVSWHGFAERGDIQVIVGGRYDNIQKVAGDIQNSIGDENKVVYCKYRGNAPYCYYVNGNRKVNDIGELAGIHEKNVANRNGGGIHIEMSRSYRNRNKDGDEKMINAIINNLPIRNIDSSY